MNNGRALRLDGQTFLWSIAIAVFIVEVLVSSRSLMGFPGPPRYYALQWTISYANGFSRRGLLGECIRLLHMDNGDYRLIALLSWLVTLTLFVVVVIFLARLLSPLDKTTKIVLFATILLSPLTTGILVATTGDPLQFTFLLYIGMSIIFLKPERNIFVTAIAFALLGVVCTLIHEASIFFIGPFLLLSAFFLRRFTLDKVAFAAFAIGVIPVLLITIHATESHAAASIAVMHFGSSPMVAAGGDFRPDSFINLFREENNRHFHSGVRGYVLLFRDLIGSLALPAFFIFLLAKVMPARKWLAAFAIPLLLSLPLWAIGHDWGRFSSYIFMLMIISLSAMNSGEHRSLSLVVASILFVLSGVTASRPLFDYLEKGLGSDNLTMLAALFICVVAMYASKLYPRSKAHAKS